jgi:cupin fold WbuC family metalloprotein
MIKTVTAAQLQLLTRDAMQNDRRRAHLNTHESTAADVQRLFISTEPGTYIRPHRHPQAHKWEFLVVVEGALDLLVFDDAGHIEQRSTLAPWGIRAVEIPAGIWHSYVCQSSGTIAMEIKQGAYIPTAAEDFAPWSPAEGADSAAAYLAWMRYGTLHSSYAAALAPEQRPGGGNAYGQR